MLMAENRRTKLYDLHVARGAKMVPFAGWDMPVQYPMGVLGEHLHTRAQAGLFDVSHMGQVILRGPDVALALETLVPADIAGLKEGRQRYGLFTNDRGGILDDLMIANKGDHLYLVVNAACAEQDIAHLRQLEAKGITVEPITDRALLALGVAPLLCLPSIPLGRYEDWAWIGVAAPWARNSAKPWAAAVVAALAALVLSALVLSVLILSVLILAVGAVARVLAAGVAASLWSGLRRAARFFGAGGRGMVFTC